MKTPSGFSIYLHLIFSIFYMGFITSDDTLTESISEMEDISEYSMPDNLKKTTLLQQF